MFFFIPLLHYGVLDIVWVLVECCTKKVGALTCVSVVIMFCRLHGFLCSWFRGRDIAALDAHVVIGI